MWWMVILLYHSPYWLFFLYVMHRIRGEFFFFLTVPLQGNFQIKDCENNKFSDVSYWHFVVYGLYQIQGFNLEQGSSNMTSVIKGFQSTGYNIITEFESPIISLTTEAKWHHVNMVSLSEKWTMLTNPLWFVRSKVCHMRSKKSILRKILHLSQTGICSEFNGDPSYWCFTSKWPNFNMISCLQTQDHDLQFIWPVVPHLFESSTQETLSEKALK